MLKFEENDRPTFQEILESLEPPKKIISTKKVDP